MYCNLLIFCINGFLWRTVFATNQLPVFTTPTSSVNIGENENGHVLLYIIPVSDPDNDAITCSTQTSDPATNYFGVWPNSTDYGLYLLAGFTLNYTEGAVYLVTIECTDGTASANMNVTVNVIPNTPPTFGNLPVTTSIINANVWELGDAIYIVSASDTDSTSLRFSATSFPVKPALFDIDPGKVFVTQDLEFAIDSAYDLAVTLSDSKDSTTSNLIIPLRKVNTAPIIDNLPATINIQENTGGEKVLYTLTISDPDSGDTLTLTYIVEPAVFMNKIKLSNQQVILKKHNYFNHEEVDQLIVTFNVSDGKVSTTIYNLTINILDINEKCTFNADSYYVTMQEAGVGGGTVVPAFTVTDEDAISSFTYSLEDNTDGIYFNIDVNSGDVSFAVNYDVDTIHPNSTNFRVTCTDNLGLTDTARLYITVEDINDNAPTFSSTASVIYFDQTMELPYNITTLIATDADSGVNAVLYYSWTTAGSGSSYFFLSPNGMIILTKSPQSYLSNGDTFRFVVTVVDGGSPALTGTATLDLIYWEVNATAGAPPSSSDDSKFTDKPGNIAGLVVGLVLGTALLGVTAFAVKKYLNKKRQGTPKSVKVEPKGMPENTRFEFWKHDEFRNLSRGSNMTKSFGQPVTLGTSRGHPAPVA